MPLPLTISNGIKVYSLNSEKTLPKWQKSKPNKSEDYYRRIELIQDLNFPSACSKICLSQDNSYLVATGTYKPRVKTFDLAQLSLKFERHLDGESVDFLVLSDDFAKICILRQDRFLEFHTQFGTHFKTKLPRNGRNLIYNAHTCDLLVTTNTAEVYRMNLEEGRFKKSIETSLGVVNHGGFCPDFRLYAFGGAKDHGVVEFFDERTRNAAASLNLNSSGHFGEVTKVKFNEGNKLQFAVGMESGVISLFDLRMGKPLVSKDHRNELPIADIAFHSSGRIITADLRGIKIWEAETGKIFTSILPKTNINSICVYPNSGVLFAACEEERPQAYFVPELGEAPAWCSFLDNITEELEEKKTKTIYDDYKFVTKDDLAKLNAETLIGSDALRPYMHGYFVNYRLYAKMKATVSNSELKEYLKGTRREKMRAKLEEKITAARRPPKPQVDESAMKKVRGDERFSKMFESADFKIDIHSEDYRMRFSTLKRRQLN